MVMAFRKEQVWVCDCLNGCINWAAAHGTCPPDHIPTTSSASFGYGYHHKPRKRGLVYSRVLMGNDVITENDLNSETTASHRINHKCTLYKDINDHIKSSHLCQSVVVSPLLWWTGGSCDCFPMARDEMRWHSEALKSFLADIRKMDMNLIDCGYRGGWS